LAGGGWWWRKKDTNLKKGFGRAGLGTGVGPGSATAVAIAPASSKLRSIVKMKKVSAVEFRIPSYFAILQFYLTLKVCKTVQRQKGQLGQVLPSWSLIFNILKIK